jgi:uncharacterized protein (TIGR00369 family)
VVDPRVDPSDLIARIPLLGYLGLHPVAPPGDDVYSVEMPLSSATGNAAGNPHGGAIATLIDHTGGHAAGRLAGRGGPTADLQIRYLAATKGTSLRADARIVRAGRRLVVVDVQVLDDLGELVAIGSLSVSPSSQPDAQPPDG